MFPNIRLRYIFSCLYYFFFDYLVIRKNKIAASNGKTIAIIHTDAIGDYILFRNFIEQIKSSDKFKDYRITLIGNELYKDLAQSLDSEFIDEFIWVNKPQFKSLLSYRKKILNTLGKRHFAIAINPSYSRDFIFGDSLIRSCKALIKIGQKADLANGYSFFRFLSSFWYTKLIDTGKTIQFEFERNKKFFEQLTHSKLAIDEPHFKSLPINSNIKNSGYITLFPGAGEIQKQWPIENFTDTAKYILANTTNKITICGSKQDFELGEYIKKNCLGNNITNLCGKTTLTELVSYIQHSELLVTNDSSALHIAACVQTKTICVGNGRHFGRFTPYPLNKFRFLVFLFPNKVEELKNSNIEKLKTLTIQKSIDSIHNITVDQVIDNCRTLLKL
jgi:ADP-heptose:LPS heptosyltransferase